MRVIERATTVVFIIGVVATMTWLLLVSRDAPRRAGGAAAAGGHPASLPRRATVASRVGEFGDSARQRLAPYFAAAAVAYPPDRFVLAVFKRERTLELHAANAGGPLRFIRRFDVLGASGTLGPKLKEGDNQVPEGVYRIEALNPNSRFHVALRLDYPNAEDRRAATAEGRGNLGSDIMIHGSDVSIGCVAMGDVVAEELFTLAADAGRERGEVWLSPLDFRIGRSAAPIAGAPRWLRTRYSELRRGIRNLGQPTP